MSHQSSSRSRSGGTDVTKVACLQDLFKPRPVPRGCKLVLSRASIVSQHMKHNEIAVRLAARESTITTVAWGVTFHAIWLHYPVVIALIFRDAP